MASSSGLASQDNLGEQGLTPAQRLMEQHAAHAVTVEDVIDEEDVAHPPPSQSITPSPAQAATSVNGNAMSEKAAGKQKATVSPPTSSAPNKNAGVSLDIQSEEAFPSLAAPKRTVPSTWGSKPAVIRTPFTNGARTNGTLSTSSEASSGISTPVRGPALPAMKTQTQPLSMPGRHSDEWRVPIAWLRSDPKKPISMVLQEINKKSKAKAKLGPRTHDGTQDYITFSAEGPTAVSVREVLDEVARQVGQKQTVKVPVPAAVRPHLIGKKGENIEAMSKRTGARIRVPKQDPNQPDGNEDGMIDVEIDGNPMALSLANNEIANLVGQRTANANLRIKEIAPELFPFIAGPHNTHLDDIQERHDVRITVPYYDTYRHEVPSSFQPHSDLHVQISGERNAAKRAQAEIEERARELQEQLMIQRLEGIERERHRFILENQADSLNAFLKETGCSIILPTSGYDSDTIAIIGPPGRIEEARDRAMDLASSMQMSSFEPRGAHTHAQDIARYLRHRQALADYEQRHNAQIVLPSGQPNESNSWQLFARNARDAMKLRSELTTLVNGLPPTRFRNLQLHPFYQRQLEENYAGYLREQHNVRLIASDAANTASAVLLVYEGPQGEEHAALVQPQTHDPVEAEAALLQAEQYLLELIGEQQEIVERGIEAPSKYREKVHRHAQRQAAEERYPVELLRGMQETTASPGHLPVNFRGPVSAVDEFERQLLAFIEEQQRDEAERDYTTSCDFPQKYSSYLIGAKGENINKLRDEYDVEIQLKDGNVEIKGPERKANAARQHITNLAKKLEDETTHKVKIPPNFHGELIGAKGAQVMRLQDRYGVRVMFPRAMAGDMSPADDGTSDAGSVTRRRTNQAPDEVLIKGPSKGAEGARSELLDLFQYAKDNAFTATVAVAESFVPSLIGREGRELRSIREKSGADVDVPKESNGSGRVQVTLKGRKAAVEAAQKLIEAKVKTFDDTIKRSVEIARVHHRSLIGRSGDNIRQIIVDAGGEGDARTLARMVQFPKAEDAGDTIVVEGPKDIVDKIINQIQTFASRRDSQVTESVHVPPERHGGLIGRGGEVKRKFEADHKVTLSIPSATVTGPERSQIQISGMPADVARAREVISGQFRQEEGVTILVPHRLHHILADAEGGNYLRNLRQRSKVTVDHDSQPRPPRPDVPISSTQANVALITDEPLTDPSDHTWEKLPSVAPGGTDDPTIPWVLRSSDATAVAKAKAAIEAAMADAEQSVTGYLVLPDPRMNRHVIGAGGNTINRIRDETGCKIDVPKAGTAGQVIQIRGTAEGVEKAKDAILEAVVAGSSRTGRP